MERIIDLELKGLLSRTDRLGYKVEITDEAKRTLAAIGYQRKYGVRALRRTLLERIEEPLSGLDYRRQTAQRGAGDAWTRRRKGGDSPGRLT